ncbi:MAG: peptidoglycan-associated lipoprotein [Rhodospirillales bacterium 20-64-7]|nr:MAG: peptidoglycan-associated lipoprotein [Rhodospirillales bacterium 20-64-7]HQT76168.1 peptidoglycan-associated lipoprotein Pal [Rhodopila sp.]
MNHRALACLLAAGLLAACSSNDTTGSTNGSGGTAAGYGAGGPGGVGGAGGAGGAGRATPGSEEDLVQSVGDRIFFNTDSSSLSPQAMATLDRQAAWLQQYPQVNVWVAGNCDERGTEEYNLALGQRRANADREYLVAHGIARTRIETISYGKSRPIDAASTPQAWAQNRNAITSVR